MYLFLLLLLPIGQSRLLPIKRSGQCSAGDHHLNGWGRWASNQTQHHLSLMHLVGIDLNEIYEHELLQNPILAGDEKCPESHRNAHDDPVMLRSLCPWYWKLNYDPKRIPAALPEAHCRCEKAVTGNRLFSCQSVTLQIRVLQFDQNCGSYRQESVEISVACVSVIQTNAVIDPQHFEGVQKTFILSPEREN